MLHNGSNCNVLSLKLIVVRNSASTSLNKVTLDVIINFIIDSTGQGHSRVLQSNWTQSAGKESIG